MIKVALEASSSRSQLQLSGIASFELPSVEAKAIALVNIFIRFYECLVWSKEYVHFNLKCQADFLVQVNSYRNILYNYDSWRATVVSSDSVSAVYKHVVDF